MYDINTNKLWDCNPVSAYINIGSELLSNMSSSLPSPQKHYRGRNSCLLSVLLCVSVSEVQLSVCVSLISLSSLGKSQPPTDPNIKLHHRSDLLAHQRQSYITVTQPSSKISFYLLFLSVLFLFFSLCKTRQVQKESVGQSFFSEMHGENIKSSFLELVI